MLQTPGASSTVKKVCRNKLVKESSVEKMSSEEKAILTQQLSVHCSGMQKIAPDPTFIQKISTGQWQYRIMPSKRLEKAAKVLRDATQRKTGFFGNFPQNGGGGLPKSFAN